MAKDSQAPATKEDVKGIMEYLVKNEEEIHKLKEEVKEEMHRLKKEMKEDKKDIKHHFDIVAENIKHDFLHGALHDRVEQHEDRIHTLEQHTGLVAA